MFQGRIPLSTDYRENAEPWQWLPFRRLGGTFGKNLSIYESGGGREGRLWAWLGTQGRLLEVVSSLENQMDAQLLRLVQERVPRCTGMGQMGTEFYRAP